MGLVLLIKIKKAVGSKHTRML